MKMDRGERPWEEWDKRLDFFEIIEPTSEAVEQFGRGWGHDYILITEADIGALRKGKFLAFYDGEYSHFILLGEDHD